jgi:hypothetical protein
MLKCLLSIGFCFLISSLVSGSADSAVDFAKSPSRSDWMIATCNCQKADWIQYLVLRANDHVRRLADWLQAALDSAYNVPVDPPVMLKPKPKVDKDLAEHFSFLLGLARRDSAKSKLLPHSLILCRSATSRMVLICDCQVEDDLSAEPPDSNRK